jgi:hypothetical protein
MSCVFIEGESIDLCIPQEGDFEPWARWFNDQRVTRFLEQGKFPHTVEMQREFYRTALQQNRFLTLVKTKSAKLLGVVSLSGISYEKRSAQIAMVVPEKDAATPCAALEATALIAQHGFERFALQRIWGGQAYPGLLNWYRKLQILGFKAEGVHRGGFVHGAQISNSLSYSLVESDYRAICERRGGSLWPGQVAAQQMCESLQAMPVMSEGIKEAIGRVHKEFDRVLEQLDRDCLPKNGK